MSHAFRRAVAAWAYDRRNAAICTLMTATSPQMRCRCTRAMRARSRPSTRPCSTRVARVRGGDRRGVGAQAPWPRPPARGLGADVRLRLARHAGAHRPTTRYLRKRRAPSSNANALEQRRSKRCSTSLARAGDTAHAAATEKRIADRPLGRPGYNLQTRCADRASASSRNLPIDGYSRHAFH